jgi:hypothetical protein
LANFSTRWKSSSSTGPAKGRQVDRHCRAMDQLLTSSTSARRSLGPGPSPPHAHLAPRPSGSCCCSTRGCHRGWSSGRRCAGSSGETAGVGNVGRGWEVRQNDISKHQMPIQFNTETKQDAWGHVHKALQASQAPKLADVIPRMARAQPSVCNSIPCRDP